MKKLIIVLLISFGMLGCSTILKPYTKQGIYYNTPDETAVYYKVDGTKNTIYNSTPEEFFTILQDKNNNTDITFGDFVRNKKAMLTLGNK